MHCIDRGSGGPSLLLVAGIPAVLGCTRAGVRRAAPQPRETQRAFAMRTDDWAERMRALAPLAFAQGVDPGFLDAFIAKKARDVQDDAGYRAQIAAVLAHDTYERLPEIAAPTLVLTGDDDRIIPGASSDVIVGAGHLFFQ